MSAKVMTDDNNSILDDLFHGCALVAFVERMAVEGRIPDIESTRRLAFQLYESALAKQHR